jgi:hypothetical protein
VYKKKEEGSDVATLEPTVRESTKRAPAQATDAADVIKKWTKK